MIFLILTACGVSGSSMGVYDLMLTGKSPGVILGTPRVIRSDEWSWQTQETLIQKADGYPANNSHISLGEDMSIILDVPFKNVFEAFKPQNLFFFILPLQHAFAAKWWFMAVVPLLGFYALMDTFFPRRRLIISIGALLLLYNPFTQWWYQSMTLLSVGYALWACYFIVRLFQTTLNKKRLVAYGLGTAYATLCFGFLLYPPFLLSVFYVIVALLFGFFYYRYRVERIPFRSDIQRWISIATAGALILLIATVFFVDHYQVIHTIAHTSYPGHRNTLSGQNHFDPDGTSFNILTVFGSPTLLNLQNTAKASQAYGNQSEASQFLAINIALIPIALISLFRRPKQDRDLSHYLLFSTSILGALLLIRLFTPLFNLPFKLLLFNQIPSERLSMALMLLGVFQVVLLGASLRERQYISRRVRIWGTIGLFAVFADASVTIAHRYPLFISAKFAILLCAVTAVSAYCMLSRKTFTLGLLVFFGLSFASSVFVNPLYSRTYAASLQSYSSQINTQYPDSKAWLVLNEIRIESLPLVAGKTSYTGIQYYPQLQLWKKFDPTGSAMSVYNRYAHVLFTDSEFPAGQNFYNPSPDELFVRLNCTTATKLPNLGHILTTTKIQTSTLLPCVTFSRALHYQNSTLYVYNYSPK